MPVTSREMSNGANPAASPGVTAADAPSLKTVKRADNRRFECYRAKQKRCVSRSRGGKRGPERASKTPCIRSIGIITQRYRDAL